MDRSRIVTTAWIATTFVLVATSGSLLFAQETGTGASTGTGSTTGTGTLSSSSAPSLSLESIQQQAAQQQWQERQDRSRNFRANMLKNKTVAEEMLLLRETNVIERNEHRTGCTLDIRRASKLTKLKTLTRCYRQELTYQLDLLQAERDYIEQIPGVTDDVRWLTLTRTDLLIDALAVVINAIDSDVYETVEELREAKANLLTNYRKPQWLMMTRLRADKLLTWTASIMSRIGTAAEEEEIPEEVAAIILDALTCLTEEESFLQLALKSSDLSMAQAQLLDAQTHMQACIELLREAEKRQGLLAQPDESTQVEEETEPEEPISRRLRRRLGEEEQRAIYDDQTEIKE